MQFAVYTTANMTSLLVLTPACMQPSMACEHRYGQLRCQGVIDLDESVLAAIAHPGPTDPVSLEYVVHGDVAARSVEAIMERRLHGTQAEEVASLRGMTFGK